MTVCPNCNAQNRDTARFCRLCSARLSRRTGIGARLGGEYHVVEVIKAGGMGTVYKAESGGTFYAVKEMRDIFTNPKERQDAINRFMAEALILARLGHPNIPRVHRHFIETDRYYLVMDFVEGEDLQVVLDRQGGKGLPEEQVLTWALQICSVLEYLHGQTPPVIFRDLKPANIMLRPNGDISLIDFGIAKLFNPARQGTLVGTPGYAAPEQYQGLAEPRSDIFGLGATLHHLLTGRDPQQHPPFNFPPVTAITPAITAGMEAIIQKALQMNLEDRWASIREIRQTLMSLAGPVKLEPGVMLAGRYQITTDLTPKMADYVKAQPPPSFMVKDVQTGTTCQLIPMGADPFIDQVMRHLAGLHHRALPGMEIVTHRGITCFVSHPVEGTLLDKVAIQSPSELISIGLQLCDLLEATGSRGAGFYWGYLQTPHVLLDPDGHIVIDCFRYCANWLFDRWWDIHLSHEDRIMSPFLTLTAYLSEIEQHDRLLQPDLEAVEVEIVGNAMVAPLTDYPFSQLGHPLGLRANVPGIPPYLEQAILGAMRGHVQTLAQLRQHLLGQADGPARATISTQRVEFGSVPWGEVLSDSIQLSSQSPGLLYGETQCDLIAPSDATARCAVCDSDNVPGEAFCDNCGAPLTAPPNAGLETQPRAFLEVHPCEIKVKISCDTSKLGKCGPLDGEILITTGDDSFRITVHGDIQPNVAFHRALAKRYLSRERWEPAIQHCDELIAMEPSDFEGYWLRGQAYHGLAQYENAVNDYTEAIRLNPNIAEIRNHRGNAYLRLKQYDSAVQDYSEAIRLNPQEPVYYWNRSLAHEAQGKARDAINDLQQYISLGGRDTERAEQRIAQLQEA